MRSRYTAFVAGDIPYLLSTWHPSTRPPSLESEPGMKWCRLDILGRTGGGILDTVGTVEFIASYRSDTGAGSQHEISRFVRERRLWFYVDGDTD